MAVEQTAKDLEEMIEQMFKVARRALQASDTTPIQRSAACVLFERFEEHRSACLAYEKAKDSRMQMGMKRRRSQADANSLPIPKDWQSRLLRRLGKPTKADLAAHAAERQKKLMKEQEQCARATRDTKRETRNKSVIALRTAQENFAAQFPDEITIRCKPQAKPAMTDCLKMPFIDIPTHAPSKPYRPGPK